jgi:hypothetical protein
MTTSRIQSILGKTMAVVLAVVVSLTVFCTIAYAALPSAAQNPDRWGRTVCRDVSAWLDAKTQVGSRAQQVLDGLTASELSATTAKRRLGRAYADGATMTSELVKGVKSAGVPKLADGKTVASQYAATLTGYRDAYGAAAAALDRANPRDPARFVTTAQQVDTTLAADLQVVGMDPIEDLRAVPELTAALAGSCGAVDRYLVQTIDAGCNGALDQVQRVVDAENTFQATPTGSPEETAAGDGLYQAIDVLRTALGPCTVPGVASAPCRTALETAQSLIGAEDRYRAAPVDSPEETAAGDESSAATTQLVSQILQCRRGAA